VGTPEYYLGGDIEYLDTAWIQEGPKIALSGKTYISNVTKQYEHLLGYELRCFKTPMDAGYHPELDDSPFTVPKTSSTF
jgi:hypothetical protein